MLKKELEKLGLSEKEAQVYLTSLEMGHASVQDIARKAGVNRATTYVILESLMKKGLASTFEKGKKRFFVAEPPERLVNYLRKRVDQLKRREEEVKNYLPELKSIYNLAQEKPVIRYYEGEEGIKALRENLFESREKRLKEIFSIEQLKKIPHVELNRKNLIKHKIEAETIYTTPDNKPIPDIVSQKAFLVPSGKYDFHSEVSIFDNKVIFVNTDEKIQGVMIENEEIANTMKNIFKLALKGAESEKK